MPYFNKTGPAGQGPMTGRGMGSCSDYETDSTFPRRKNWFGRGFGIRMGRRLGGLGFRGFSRFMPFQKWYENFSYDEASEIKDYKAFLKKELEKVETYEKNHANED